MRKTWRVKRRGAGSASSKRAPLRFTFHAITSSASLHNRPGCFAHLWGGSCRSARHPHPQITPTMHTPTRSVLLGLFLLALLVPTAHAQYGAGGLNVVLAIPQGAFADRIDGVGYGLGGEFVFHIPNTPVGLGIEGTFVTYGHERIRTRFGSGAL